MDEELCKAQQEMYRDRALQKRTCKTAEDLELFKVANELYGSNVYSYYFDITFEETIRRHQTRSKSQEFGEEHMRGWWREKDFSAVLKEQLITCEMDANSIVAKVYADLLKEE